MTTQQLEDYFNTIDLEVYNGTKINNFTKLINARKFVNSHLDFLKYNKIEKRNKTYELHLERLIEFKNTIELSKK